MCSAFHQLGKSYYLLLSTSSPASCFSNQTDDTFVHQDRLPRTEPHMWTSRWRYRRKSEYQENQWDSSSGEHEHNFKAVHPAVFEIFHRITRRKVTWVVRKSHTGSSLQGEQRISVHLVTWKTRCPVYDPTIKDFDVKQQQLEIQDYFIFPKSKCFLDIKVAK